MCRKTGKQLSEDLRMKLDDLLRDGEECKHLQNVQTCKKHGLCTWTDRQRWEPADSPENMQGV